MLGDGAPDAHKAPHGVREAAFWTEEKERQKVGGHAGSHSQEGHARDTCGLLYPQCRPCGWCLDSEHTGTPQAPEGRKRNVSQRPQGLILFHTMKDDFPQGVAAKQLSWEIGVSRLDAQWGLGEKY